MIECIFTLDYEIYGDGTGRLQELVYEPAKKLQEIFRRWSARFVNFVEVAEFEKIDEQGSDPYIDRVKEQVRRMHQDGFEIALHLHPQWYNGRHEDGRWILDESEYNLCTLPAGRIAEIVRKAVRYLQHMVGDPDFSPLSFRAGNWLFQPTETAARILAESGIRIDSSVFKGGVQRNHGLDYRAARRNGYCWRFGSDANQEDSTGGWIEVPIYTEMVSLWKMRTSKRMSFVRGAGGPTASRRQRVNRALDFLRPRYPMKLDFCRMTLRELTSMVSRVIDEDHRTPWSYRPLVAIGHTKDLTDYQTVHDFLEFLRTNGVTVSTFEKSHRRLSRECGFDWDMNLERSSRPSASTIQGSQNELVGQVTKGRRE
jgi:hypothetical protein